MKKKSILVVLVLCLVLVGVPACNPFGGDKGEEPELQLTKVVRGDLSVTVSGDGNIEAPREVRLTFGSAGKVARINFKEGDEVNEGDLLAKLNTSALELAKSKAEATLEKAQIAVTKAELTQQTADHTINITRESEGTLNLALFNAQITLRQKEHALDETRDIYTWPEIEVAKNNLEDAEAFLEYLLTASPSDATFTYAQARVNAAQAILDAMVQSFDTEEVAIAKLQVEAAEKSVAQAQKDIEDLYRDIAIKEIEVAKAQESVVDAQKSVELARLSLEDVQRQIDEATINAPFAGVIAGVGVEEEEFVTTVTEIVHLIDTTSLELILEVDEIDIPGVEIGQEAIIDVDALPDTFLKGTVTFIYPTPNLIGGVVLYDVKINLPVPSGSGLMIGMSASADIVTTKRSNVLLVPSRAIEQNDEGYSVVKVVENGQTEERRVITGISNGLDTEIISGISEGETVVVETRIKKKEEGGSFFGQ